MADWKTELGNLFKAKEEKAKTDEAGVTQNAVKADAWIERHASPAFDELKAELEKYGKEVTVSIRPTEANITVKKNGAERFELSFTVVAHVNPNGVRLSVKTRQYDRTGMHFVGDNMLTNYSDTSDIAHATKDDVIKSFMHSYQMSVF